CARQSFPPAPRTAAGTQAGSSVRDHAWEASSGKTDHNDHPHASHCSLKSSPKTRTLILKRSTKLWTEVAHYVQDFFADLHEHNVGDKVTMLLFSEFGRRVKDNGSGTDHGTGGVALVVGDKVKGGLYSEYPSLAPAQQADGDLQFNYDFRGLYATILE